MVGIRNVVVGLATTCRTHNGHRAAHCLHNRGLMDNVMTSNIHMFLHLKRTMIEDQDARVVFYRCIHVERRHWTLSGNSTRGP